MIERLESAYQVRFEKEAVLVFLNDAYQNALMLRRDYSFENDESLAAFLSAIRGIYLLVRRWIVIHQITIRSQKKSQP